MKIKFKNSVFFLVILITALFLQQSFVVADVTGRTYLQSVYHRQQPHRVLPTMFELEPGREIACSISAFYQQSFHPKKPGRYFGVNDKHELLVGENPPNPGNGPGSDELADVFYGDLIHGADALGIDRITLKPQEKLWGMLVEARVPLVALSKNLSMGITIPVVHVEHELSQFFDHIKPNLDPDCVGIATLQDFLSGQQARFGQEPLARGKWYDGKKATTGAGDVRLQLQYALPFQDGAYYIAGCGVILPAGNKPNFEFLYEPVRGNGHHYGVELFGGLQQKIHFDDYVVTFDVGGSYQHLFSNYQQRLLGLKGIPWGQYSMLGDTERPTNFLLPALNALDLACKVEPADLYQLSMQVGAHWAHAAFVLGYRLAACDQESIKVKGEIPAARFGEIVRNYAIGGPFAGVANDLRSGIDNDFITLQQVDRDAAAVAAQVSHQLSLELNYAFFLEKMQISLKMWAKGGFSANNASHDFWGFGLGLGFSL